MFVQSTKHNVFNTETLYVYLKFHVFNMYLSHCGIHWDNCVLSMWKVKVILNQKGMHHKSNVKKTKILKDIIVIYSL